YAAIALIIHQKIGDDDGSLAIPVIFLVFFPVIVIPVFWIIYITTITHIFDSISILFITLFGILLISTLIFFILWIYRKKNDGFDGNIYIDYFGITHIASMFYAPNILQTLLIVLYWPINFYFVKSFVFIIV